MLAIQSLPLPSEAVVRAPEERLGQYALLRRLPAGLRAEVWLGLPPGCASLGQLVAIKAFFPHVKGPALAALSAELSLAPRLGHSNIVRTLRVDRDGQRPFIVSEHLEGMTLRALLRRVRVERASIGAPSLARVLLGIVRAVCHAQRQVATSAEKALVAQTIAADDVFITFDGAVKLLGFKAQLANIEPSGPVSTQPDPSAPAAIDALLSEHLTPELGRVLEAACSNGSRGLYGLTRIGRELERWQAEALRSEGRGELAALMDLMFPSARLEQRAQLEFLLEQWTSARSPGAPLSSDLSDAPPASGFRTVTA
ncbi:MAG TPA: protein kinase [Polyangiaceae bacterium]|nr:protein kinase [Polyangiaceae bacterium]